VIKTFVACGTVVSCCVFALGCYVGWKTTLAVLDSVEAKKRKA